VTVFDAGERRAWAGRAEAYAGSFAKLCAYPVPRLLDAAGVEEGVRVLDVGTGPGTVAAAAAERHARVTAVDAQPDMVAWASRAVPVADVRVATLPQLPFEDDEFDAVVGNFVLNHVGTPLAALIEMARVTRPGGRIALTIWAAPAGAGAQLLLRAVQASGAPRPPDLPPFPPEQDFERDESGFAALMSAARLSRVECRSITWDHRATAEEWWSGPASGVAFVGQVLANSSAETVQEIKAHFDRFSAEFVDVDGRLRLPHRALLARASV
jgi:SAM-dependent methyltransferase